VVTALLGALQFHSLLRKKLNMPNLTSILSRVIVSAMVMGISVWAIGLLIHQQSDLMTLLVSIGTGFIVYVSLILGLRLLDQTDWSLIRMVFRRVNGILRPAKTTTG
jgi:Polysaccharide biosynthesis C-terminal domain